jgi:hypothetical protein
MKILTNPIYLNKMLISETLSSCGSALAYFGAYK